MNSSRIDPGGRAVQGLTTFLSFVVLNILFLVACLPVITLGAAGSALLEVTLRYADEERGYLVKDFVLALGRNALRATAVHLLLSIPMLLLAFAAAFWLMLDSPLSLMAALVAGLGAVYLLAALIHGLALVAAFDAGIGRTLRNALLLPGAEPLRTMGLVLIPVTGLALVLIMPVLGWILVTIGCSFGAYLMALLLRPVHSRHAGAA